MDNLRKPPPWRNIAAALRRFLNPEAKQPKAPISAADEQRIVDDFRERVPRAVQVYKSTAAARSAPASAERLVVVLADTIDEFVMQRAPAGADRRPLVARLRRELPELMAEAWSPKPPPPATPTPEPIRPSAKAMSARIPLTPEQQARIDEFRAGIGAALAANLNRNVMRQAQEEAVEAARKDAEFQAFLVRATELPADGDQLRLFN